MSTEIKTRLTFIRWLKDINVFKNNEEEEIELPEELAVSQNIANTIMNESDVYITVEKKPSPNKVKKSINPNTLEKMREVKDRDRNKDKEERER